MNPDLYELLTQLITLAIQSAAAAAGIYIAKEIHNWLRANTTIRQQQIIREILTAAVKAAEQLGGTSAEKKAQAVTTADHMLLEKGISLTLSAIGDLVEATVYEAINQDRAR